VPVVLCPKIVAVSSCYAVFLLVSALSFDEDLSVYAQGFLLPIVLSLTERISQRSSP